MIATRLPLLRRQCFKCQRTSRQVLCYEYWDSASMTPRSRSASRTGARTRDARVGGLPHAHRSKVSSEDEIFLRRWR